MRIHERHDPQAFLRQIPPLLAQEEPENRQAPQSRHLCIARGRAQARARGPVLQTPLIFLKAGFAIPLELAANGQRSRAMIKDLVVNLSVAPERDPAAEYALSVARAFAARIAGIVFQSDPITPTALMDSMPPPPELIETLRMESERGAKAAASRFDEAARLASVSFETRIVTSTVTGAATRFAEIARRSDEIPGADIAEHLAHHGLNVKVTRTVSGDIDVANVILSHAADSGADFLVMGGYGHSRLREFTLGGATRGILTSMTVPTLMSH